MEIGNRWLHFADGAASGAERKSENHFPPSDTGQRPGSSSPAMSGK
jgi:hypothetical protein